MNIKLYNSLRSTTFIFIIYSSEKVIVTLFIKFIYLYNVVTTLSDEQMTKIKVVDLDEFYNFVVDDFFS